MIYRPDLKETIFKDFYIPYCWWLEGEWLYVRWYLENGKEDKPLVRYRKDDNGELEYEMVLGEVLDAEQ